MQDTTTKHLFVYGTLRSTLGHPMHHWLARRAELIGPASLPGTLYDLGAYPGAVVSGEQASKIYGEVYALPSAGRDALLARLDAYEGCGPSFPDPEYTRTVSIVMLSDGRTLPAWVYLYRSDPYRFRRIPRGDYVAYLRRGA